VATLQGKLKLACCASLIHFHDGVIVAAERKVLESGMRGKAGQSQHCSRCGREGTMQGRATNTVNAWWHCRGCVKEMRVLPHQGLAQWRYKARCTHMFSLAISSHIA
jgi:hypothetical protein